MRHLCVCGGGEGARGERGRLHGPGSPRRFGPCTPHAPPPTHTPSRGRRRYWYQRYPPENINLGGNNAAQLWYPRQANYFALIQHFGWHAGAASGGVRDEDGGAAALAQVDVARSECSERAYNPEGGGGGAVV